MCYGVTWKFCRFHVGHIQCFLKKIFMGNYHGKNVHARKYVNFFGTFK
jgi:hypothetical protein